MPDIKKTKRDKLIKELWVTFRELYNLQGSDNFTDEDLNLWTNITAHSSLQKQLGKEEKKIC